MKNQFTIDKHDIRLQQADVADQDFQFVLYADTRQEEMGLVDWSNEQKNAFLQQQFQAQTSHYQVYYPGAETKIILMDEERIGRLILYFTQEYLLIIDIALLFRFRNLGIGSILLKELMDEATTLNLPIILRVEIFNPAIHLYQRLGFQKTRSLEVYQEMVWKPPQLNIHPK